MNQIKTRISGIGAKKLYIGFFISHLFLIYLLGPTTAFAPDERIYLKVFENLYSKNFSLSDFHNGWQFSSLTFLKIIYAPALFLVELGLDKLYAIRVLAIIFSFFTLLTLCKIYFLSNPSEKKVPIFILLGIFLPSFFLWTTIGLRESFYFFFIISIFFVLLLYESKQLYIFLILLISLLCSLYLTKPHLFLLMMLAVIFAFFISTLKTKKVVRKNLLILIISLLPLVLFFNKTEDQIEVIKKQLKNYNNYLQNNANGSKIIKLDEDNIKSVTETEIFIESQRGNIMIFNVFDRLKIFESTKNNTNYSHATISNPFSIVKASFHFLLWPNPLTDNGSIFLNFISVEFVFWIFFYIKLILYLILLKTKNHKLTFPQLVLVVFIIFFILFSALVETNLGTSLRHKSLLLLLILILLSTGFRSKIRDLKSEPIL